ncbi:perlucin-like protein [Mytilus edulis]|uniref:perlucin-like protein n=1 Tax=Mytilus edulis TaxID=6550 RepID=UPI0039F0B373
MKLVGHVLIVLFVQFVDVDSLLISNCPHGWLPHSGNCYGFFKHLVSWYDASSACKAHTGYLATIETSDENTFLKTQSKIINANFWVGGEDDLIEGEWTWAETDEPFDFTDWISTQPDNSQGEDCLALWQAASWQWNDWSCESHSYYICEKSISGSGGAIIGK